MAMSLSLTNSDHFMNVGCLVGILATLTKNPICCN